MKVLLLVTTLALSHGNVYPDIEVVELDSPQECISMTYEIQKQAREDGEKVYTGCTYPKKLEDYE